jgi:hypothetical protein
MKLFLRCVRLLADRTLVLQQFYAAPFLEADTEEQRHCAAVPLRSRREIKSRIANKA